MTGSLEYVQAQPIEGEVLHTDPDCPLCPPNGKITIIEDNGGMFLARVKDMSTMQDRTDRWLVIPANHTTETDELPLCWGETLFELVRTAGLESDYNLSLNVGPRAGQTLPHLHWWLLDRRTDEIDKGMDWFISEVPRLTRICQVTEAENGRLRRVVENPRDRDALLA